MSAREWAPGTVALVKTRARIGMTEELVAIREHSGGRWATESGTWADSLIASVRPVVVLDLVGQDVPSLLRHLRGSPGCHFCEPIAKQIRKQTRDPKPAEPQGLGAVVVYRRNGHEGEAVRWSRLDPQPWKLLRHNLLMRWSDIDVARVLSEGVGRAPEEGA